MANHLIQTNFTGGEWSELLEGRVDLEKYGNAARRMENFLIDPRGPAMFRPGLRFIAGTKTNAKASRLIPFEFSVTQAYMLEFGDQYIRFFRNQEQITTAPATPYEISSPYLEADVASIKICQSADVLYLFHASYAPRKLSRTGHTAWVLAEINFAPPAVREQGDKPAATLTLSDVTGADITFTASVATFLPGDVGRVIVSGAGRASITKFTSDTVVICDIIDDFSAVGPIASQQWSMNGSANGNIKSDIKSPVGAIATLKATEILYPTVNLTIPYAVDWIATDGGGAGYYLKNTSDGYTFITPAKVFVYSTTTVDYTELAVTYMDLPAGVLGALAEGSWAFGDFDSLGYDTIYIRLAADDNPNFLLPGFLKRSPVPENAGYFRSSDVGKYVRIYSGMVRITSYVSHNEVKGVIIREMTSYEPSVAWTLESDAWDATNGYPSCGTFYEERLVLSGSTAYPETIWGSEVGDYENFTPGTDDSDAFEFTIAGRKVNVIRWLEPREYLIAGTVGGEWRVGPEDTGTSLTPLNVVAKEERNYGSADIAPVTVAGSTLFVQRAGRKIREFTYQWEQNGYVAPDLTLLADHITEGTLAGIVYQQEPLSIVWAWTVTGELIALTYLREQDVVGWHRHPTDGVVESLAVIPGDGYDEVWAIVNRTINGATVRYVEMLEKLFTDTAAEFTANKGLNAFFVDSGITYNGAATVTIPGLGHLVGETVAVLADGLAVTNKVVSAAGTITLPAAASVVHAGLPYTGTIQTMRINTNLGDGTAQGREKKIHDIILRVCRSGPFKAGRNESNLDACFDRERTLTLGAPYPLFTGDIRLGFDGAWERDGRIMIVQDRPMPLTLVAVMPEVSVK